MRSNLIELPSLSGKNIVFKLDDIFLYGEIWSCQRQKNITLLVTNNQKEYLIDLPYEKVKKRIERIENEKANNG